MFSEDELNKFEEIRENIGETEYEEIPIRKVATQKVKFTEKIYPHLAARDTFYKEPPMPKNKSLKLEQDADL